MENREPKVSVIVPVYNTEKYLEQAVYSIMSQTLREIEIILVNDGSTDKSVEILDKLVNIDSRIKVLSQINAGQSKARNLGLSISLGKYVYFMDSDDLLDKEALQQCFDKCENESLDFVFFDAEDFSDNNIIIEGLNYLRTGLIDDVVYSGEIIINLLINKSIYRVPPWQYFINRDFYKKSKLSFYEGIIHEDELFTPQLYLNARRVGRIDKPFYKRRFREDSIMSSTFSMKNMNAYFTVSRELKELKSRLDNNKQRILTRLISKMLNAALYKAHSLAFKDKLDVLTIAISQFAFYLNLKTLFVLFLKK